MANCKLRIANCTLRFRTRGSIFGGQPGPQPQGEKSRSVYVVVLKQGMVNSNRFCRLYIVVIKACNRFFIQLDSKNRINLQAGCSYCEGVLHWSINDVRIQFGCYAPMTNGRTILSMFNELFPLITQSISFCLIGFQ